MDPRVKPGVTVASWTGGAQRMREPHEHLDRLRRERLARAKQHLQESELGALLCTRDAIVEPGRVQIDDTNLLMNERRRRGTDVTERDRADVTEILGDDHIRARGFQSRELDLVDGQRVLEDQPDLSVSGKSHSCEIPTRSASAPSAQTISVAAGSNEATR